MKTEELLQKLKVGATPKTIKTLDAIYEVCIEQVERGVHDFSYVTICRLGAKKGVPKPQSIRNQSGIKYQALIKSFADTVTIDKRKLGMSGDDWVEEINNPKHKILIRSLLAELKDAKNKVNEIIPPGTRIDVFDHNSHRDSGLERLTIQERRAMEYLISEEFLSKWHFKATCYGEIVDDAGQVVFKAATIDAIKKALMSL